MSNRTYDGPALDLTEQWISERPYRAPGETVDGSSGEDVGEERTVRLPNVAVARTNRPPKPLSDDVETALQTIETEVHQAHRYRETLKDARTVVRFAQRVCDDEELLQVVGQLARVLNLEDGAGSGE